MFASAVLSSLTKKAMDTLSYMSKRGLESHSSLSRNLSGKRTKIFEEIVRVCWGLGVGGEWRESPKAIYVIVKCNGENSCIEKINRN